MDFLPSENGEGMVLIPPPVDESILDLQWSISVTGRFHKLFHYGMTRYPLPFVELTDWAFDDTKCAKPQAKKVC